MEQVTHTEAQMIVFLKSIDSKTWKVVVTRWSPSQVAHKDVFISQKSEKKKGL